MKRCVVLFLALFCATVAIADINDGLVAYYTFDVPGDPGHDAVSGLDATEVVGVTQVGGVSGQAGLFANGWMLLPDVAAFDLLGGDFTFSVFVKGSVNPNNRNWFTKTNPVHHRYGLAGSYEVSFGFNGGPNGYVLTTSIAFDETWHHIAGVKRGSIIEIWFDGVLEGSGPVDTNFVDDGGIAVGRNGQCCEYFNGHMDEARIYDRALSAAEISQLAGGQGTGLIAYYPLDGNAQDSSGNGHHGVVDGATATQDRFGSPGKAYFFDGVDDWIYIPASTDLKPAEITLAAWAKRVIRVDSQIMVGMSEEANTYWMGWQWDKPAGILNANWIIGPEDIVDNAWHHVAVTHNSSVSRLYIDGTLAKEMPSLTGPLSGYYGNRVCIGGEDDNNDGVVDSYFFEGAIDDVRIYDRALTEQEIQDLYGDGAPTPITYVALGDSYSSGEGAGEYDPDTDEEYVNECHQSDTNAWSGTSPGGDEDGKVLPVTTTRKLLACSGSRSRHLWEPRFFAKNGRGDWNGNEDCDTDEPCVSPQFEESPLLATADLVTVTIGGNDLVTGDRDDASGMFAVVIKECVMDPHCTPEDHHGNELLGNWALEILNHLNADEFTEGSLRYSFRRIKEEAPGATVMVANYPQLFWNYPSANGCGDEGFDANEMEWLNDFAVDFQSVVQCAALDQGVLHVPISFGKNAHCRSDQQQPLWLHGVYYWSNVSNWTHSKESMHPNPLGQAAIASAIRRKLPSGGVSGELPGNPTPVPCTWTPGSWNTAGSRDSSTPTHDGTLYMEATVPGCGLVENTFVAGQQVLLTGEGFAALTNVDLRLRASYGLFDRYLGVVNTDSSGALSDLIVLPADAPQEGPALLDAMGSLADGETLLLQRFFSFLPSLDADSDTDGVPDFCDNCPAEDNSGQTDADSDGFGDACDNCSNDQWNDIDGDGLCADVDPCPLDPTNTTDTDGTCFNVNGIFTNGFESGDTSAWSGAP